MPCHTGGICRWQSPGCENVSNVVQVWWAALVHLSCSCIVCVLWCLWVEGLPEQGWHPGSWTRALGVLFWWCGTCKAKPMKNYNENNQPNSNNKLRGTSSKTKTFTKHFANTANIWNHNPSLSCVVVGFTVALVQGLQCGPWPGRVGAPHSKLETTDNTNQIWDQNP